MDKTYYVYGHYLTDADEVPFYIGKGRGSRAYSANGRNNDWKETAKNGFVVKIFKDGMTESVAYDMEIALIQKYGRKCINGGSLVNMLPGGANNLMTKEVPDWLKQSIKQHMFTRALRDYNLAINDYNIIMENL